MVELNLGFRLVAFVFLSSNGFCSLVQSICNGGCELALGSYYFEQGNDLSSISLYTNNNINNIFKYNPVITPNPDTLPTFHRINVPFPCDCINGDFLGHVFSYSARPQDTYDLIAEHRYANLTTAAWIQSFNAYDPNRIPDNAVLNVTVNCSCGDNVLFVTYPLRPGETLDSVAYLSSDLSRSYNPDANFSAGSGLVFIPVRDDPSHSHRKKRVNIRLPLSISAGVVVLGLILGLYTWSKKRRSDAEREGRAVKVLDKDDHSSNKKGSVELPLFSLSRISRATNNFSIDNKLGEGGFGPVYKGVLEEGREIAVKRLSKSSRQGVDEFENEVICIAKLQHRNLVMLLGYCIQGDETMLIYEYMPNKSLDCYIFDDFRKSLLDWSQRFHIIHGIARGLLYLHQDSRLRVVHRDLKAGNILLDHDMNPKISDFGLARMFQGHESEANTKRVVGTLGYISPEYAVNGLFSVKSDIFSFGVLVLEIVSGKKNRGFVHEDHHDNLLGHAWRLYREGKSLDLIDTSLGKSWSVSQVLRSIHIGLLCVQQRAEDRPNTPAMVAMLGGEGLLPSPKQPGFFIQRSESSSTTNIPLPSSLNGVTISEIDGR